MAGKRKDGKSQTKNDKQAMRLPAPAASDATSAMAQPPADAAQPEAKSAQTMPLHLPALPPKVSTAEAKLTEDREQMLRIFFASPDELAVAGTMSLDLYREQADNRLRAEGVQEYLSFALATELYAVNIYHIKEIIKVPPITEVPRTEPVILGILSLRGTIAPVVDLRRRLGLDAAPHSRRTRILIVALHDEIVGLLVDEVRHVIRLKDEDVEPPPGVFDRAEAEHIKGVGRQEGEMYTLLELESIIQIDRFLRG